MTNWEIYADIEHERRLRRMRRQARIEREERIERAIYPIRRAFEYALAAIAIYGGFWLLAFWASY